MRNCTKCHQEISAERLDVLPDTTICATCVKQKEYVKPVVRKEVLDPQPYMDVKIPYVRMFERKSSIILGRTDPVIPKSLPKETLVEFQFYTDGSFHKSFRYRVQTVARRYPITPETILEYLHTGYTFCVRDGVLSLEHPTNETIEIGRPRHEMVVYKTTNTVNGMIYVGQDAKNNPKYLGSGNLLKEALHQYGRHCFVKEILEVCDPNYMLSDRDRQRLLNEREEHWIKKLRARNPTIGYNLSNPFVGGTRADHRTHKIQVKIDEQKQILQQPKQISRRPAIPNETFHSYDITDL